MPVVVRLELDSVVDADDAVELLLPLASVAVVVGSAVTPVTLVVML